VVALLKGEPPGDRVSALVAEDEPAMSSINLGEVLYSLVRSHGWETASDRVEAVRQVVRVHDPDWALVRQAASAKADGGLSYADAFCVALARRLSAAVATGDPELVRLGDTVQVIDLTVPSSAG
jgi:predicted nucleic acid-binding protein